MRTVYAVVTVDHKHGEMHLRQCETEAERDKYLAFCEYLDDTTVLVLAPVQMEQ